MIFEKILTVLVNFICGLLNGVINVNFLDEFITNFNSVFDTFLDIVSFALFFFPVAYLQPLFAVIFGVIGLRIAIAVVKFILTFIPFMGGS